MYCPKCAQENPDDGRFCRKCGLNLSGISTGTSGKQFSLEGWTQDKLAPHFSGSHTKSKKKKKGSWESAMGTLFSGIAFLVIAVVLAFQPMGTGWWFWMFIPAFAMIGSGVAQILKITYGDDGSPGVEDRSIQQQIPSEDIDALPPKQTTFASEYSPPGRQTDKVNAPSVTEETTRRLEMETDGKTTKLPED